MISLTGWIVFALLCGAYVVIVSLLILAAFFSEGPD